MVRETSRGPEQVGRTLTFAQICCTHPQRSVCGFCATVSSWPQSWLRTVRYNDGPPPYFFASVVPRTNFEPSQRHPTPRIPVTGEKVGSPVVHVVYTLRVIAIQSVRFYASDDMTKYPRRARATPDNIIDEGELTVDTMHARTV